MRTFCLFVFLLLLVRTTSVWCVSDTGNNIRKSEIEAYNWIKNNTPETSGYYDTKEPEYGILAYWDFGNQINYYAHRPVIANNMQNGVKNMADIFSSKDEETAYNLCEELKVKYVFIAPDRVLFPSTIDYWPEYKKQERGPGYRSLSYNVERSKDYNNWFFAWLTNDFGLRSRGNFRTSSYFRIIFANSENNSPTFSTMLFERVKGAKLVLQAKPNSMATVTLKIRLKKNFFNYRKELKVPDDGYVTFNLPYSCYFNNGTFSTNELYDISLVSCETGKKVVGKVSIKEKDVVEGNVVATNSVVIFK